MARVFFEVFQNRHCDLVGLQHTPGYAPCWAPLVDAPTTGVLNLALIRGNLIDGWLFPPTGRHAEVAASRREGREERFRGQHPGSVVA